MIVKFNNNTYELYLEITNLDHSIRAKYLNSDFTVVILNNYFGFELNYKDALKKEHLDLVQDLKKQFSYFRADNIDIDSLGFTDVITNFFEYYTIKKRDLKLKKLI